MKRKLKKFYIVFTPLKVFTAENKDIASAYYFPYQTYTSLREAKMWCRYGRIIIEAIEIVK